MRTNRSKQTVKKSSKLKRRVIHVSTLLLCVLLIVGIVTSVFASAGANIGQDAVFEQSTLDIGEEENAHLQNNAGNSPLGDGTSADFTVENIPQDNAYDGDTPIADNDQPVLGYDTEVLNEPVDVETDQQINGMSISMVDLRSSFIHQNGAYAVRLQGEYTADNQQAAGANVTVTLYNAGALYFVLPESTESIVRQLPQEAVNLQIWPDYWYNEQTGEPITDYAGNHIYDIKVSFDLPAASIPGSFLLEIPYNNALASEAGSKLGTVQSVITQNVNGTDQYSWKETDVFSNAAVVPQEEPAAPQEEPGVQEESAPVERAHRLYLPCRKRMR